MDETKRQRIVLLGREMETAWELVGKLTTELRDLVRGATADEIREAIGLANTPPTTMTLLDVLRITGEPADKSIIGQ